MCVAGREQRSVGEKLCIAFRYVVGDRKNKESRGRPRRKERLGERLPEEGLLRKKSSSLSMLLGWSSVSVTTLKIQSIYLDLMERMLVL
jgi:hypothetical protein